MFWSNMAAPGAPWAMASSSSQVYTIWPARPSYEPSSKLADEPLASDSASLSPELGEAYLGEMGQIQGYQSMSHGEQGYI